MSGGHLKVEELTKTFGAVTAVDDVTLSFESGKCHGLIGPNGSGKTTLFDLLTGFQVPDSGVVEFDGEDVTGSSPDRLARRGLVRTFQVVSPFEGLTVRENLHSVYASGLRSGLRVPDRTVDRAEEVLDLLELRRVADHEASDVSGGQAKLLELGRALMLEPDCLLLDEPTAGVNPTIQRRVIDALDAVNDRGTTLVVIEHDMRVIEDLADRITVLTAGRVLTRGSFAEVVADEDVREAYIGRRRDATGGSERALDAVEATVVANGDGDPRSAIQAGDSTGTTQEGDTADGATGVADATAALQETSGAEGTVDTTTVASDRPGRAGTTVDRDVDSLATALGSADAGGGERLVARDVVAGYGSHVVLDGVTVESRDGVTCVFGPNGSGKSTLLKAIGGVVPVRSGTVEYGDRAITNAEPHEIVRAGVTTVPQTDQVFRGLSVRENLLLGGTPVADESVVDARMDAVLDVFPALESSLSAPANSLSGGQQVMLGVARGMMTGADVYLLDEPFSGLAPSKIDEVFEVVRALVETDAQVILVEQHVREALSIADHVYVLARGEIQFDGSPADLRDADEVVDLYLGID